MKLEAYLGFYGNPVIQKEEEEEQHKKERRGREEADEDEQEKNTRAKRWGWRCRYTREFSEYKPTTSATACLLSFLC